MWDMKVADFSGRQKAMLTDSRANRRPGPGIQGHQDSAVLRPSVRRECLLRSRYVLPLRPLGLPRTFHYPGCAHLLRGLRHVPGIDQLQRPLRRALPPGYRNLHYRSDAEYLDA